MVMHGFKSFAQRTELVFGEGFNCVLGPNGSGKSNILDALCFVLGRLSSKALRAEKAANLVYNGGKTKKPMKQGEVSLFFDNSEKTFPTEDPFVKITRIIKNSGQSVYKINDQKRTRQQILDLMAVARIDPEGYNIILQGDIVKFTAMHPEERRLLIEEISGISVYEEKKQKALRELGKVDERLKEAGIVLAEREAHLKELEKEKNQALKFKELEKKINTNKASYLYIQIESKEKRKNALTEKINSRQAEINKFTEEINGIRELIRKKREEIDNINREIEEKAEKEQVSMQRDIEQLKINLATNNQRIEHCKSEISKIESRKEQLNQSLQELDQEIASLNTRKKEIIDSKTSKLEELNKVEEKINEIKQDNSIEGAADIEKQIDEFDKKIEEKQEEVNTLRKHQQDLLRKKDGVEFQIGNIDDQIKKVLRIEEEHADEIATLKDKKKRFKESITDLNTRLEQDSKFAVSISEEKNKLRKAQEQLAKLEARNVSIKENTYGNLALRKILELKKSGVHGTIAELGTVNKDYSLALEIAAGPRLNSIVVEDDKIAADCIKYLKEKKFGTATFLPLNKLKSRVVQEGVKDLVKKDNVHGLAVDLVDFDKKYEKAFSYVFGSTLVVDNIDTARNLGIGSSRMVTLDGDLAEVSGAMQGGFRQKKRFAFKEKEIISDIEKHKNLIVEVEKVITELLDNRETNEEKISNLREERANLEGDIIKTEKGLHLDSGEIDASKQKKENLKEELKTVKNSIVKIEENIDEINKELTDSKIKKQELKSKVNEIRNPSMMAELNAFEERKTAMKEEIMETDNNIKAINTEIKDLKEPEKERIDQILKNNSKEAEDFNQEIVKLNEFVEAVKQNLEVHEKKAQEFYARNKEMIAKKNQLEDSIEAEDGFIEIERAGSTIVQLGKFRIVITRPPFSDGWEITAVRPVKHLTLDDYKLSEKLLKRLEKQAEGILISGAPGMGKSTFAAALTEYYADKGKIVKTVEAPRDLVLPDKVTQYAISHVSSP